MQVDLNTKMITLIGTPLNQSYAARMQNAGYKASGLNFCYFYTEASAEHLKEIIDAVRYMPSFAGCAVTKPNKVSVLKYLDELDPLCEKMGACNTVVKRSDGKLIGYNTDGIGFFTSFTKETGMKVENASFFCIGAGGAGRAICSVLAYHKAKKIYVMDSFASESKTLAEDINRNFAQVAEYVEYGDFSDIQKCDVVINASGIGMGATVGQSPLPEEYILARQLYFDACYNPAKTQFLLNAEEKGGKILNGLGMSLYQGCAQFSLWSGEEAPVDAMRQELLNILKEASL